jgi:UDP-glucose 4-epimerase
VLDNYHNSFPTAISRVEQLALDSLPADASQEDKDACKIDLVKGDLRDKASIQSVFDKYQGEDKIWAVILVAALKAVGESGEIPIE